MNVWAVQVVTNVSEEHITSIFRDKIYFKYARLNGITSQKTTINIISTAVRT
jgi:hypothetical protein